MFSLKTVLLPTDFSPCAKDVAAHATELARHFHAKLALLYVFPPLNPAWAAMGGGGTVLDEVLDNQRDLARKQLDSFLQPELDGFNVSRVLLEGDPADAIVQYAHANDVSLIMMPTRGCGPLRRLILGSVTEKVLHHAKCPVWTGVHIVEPAAGVPFGVRRVVCAVGVTPRSAVVLRRTAEFAEKSQARLIVVHAIPAFDFRPATYYSDADMRKRTAAEARAEIARMLEDCGPQNAEIRIESGSVPSVVHSITESQRADLLVMGRASTPGLFEWLRANSYAIVRESPCPVVSM
jgi:nucleotide-binding universal stress UspA family protein